MAEIPKTHINRLETLKGKLAKEVLARDKAQENIASLRESIEEVQYKMFQAVIRDSDLSFTEAMEAIQVLVGEDKANSPALKAQEHQNKPQEEEEVEDELI